MYLVLLGGEEIKLHAIFDTLLQKFAKFNFFEKFCTVNYIFYIVYVRYALVWNM